MASKYKRILLKISGEVLAGEEGKGINFDVANEICSVIKECVDMGTQVGLVVGGGNFWRGRSSGKMDRSRADQMGMLGTMINCLRLCRFNKTAGIYYNHIATNHIRTNIVAGFLHAVHHTLTVHLIFCTTQGYKTNICHYSSSRKSS